MRNPWHALRGQERLWVVFWLYCVLGTAALTWLFVVAVVTMLEPLRGELALVVLYTAYLVWAHVALWTCAFNTKRRPWGYVARTYSFALLAVLAVSMVWPTVATTGQFEVFLVQ